VYFENLTDLHIFINHWKFINYINLSPLEEKEKVLKFYLNKIDLLYYSKYGYNIACSGLQELERLQRKLVSLKIDKETINNLQIDQMIKNKQRRKRDVFNFVGQSENPL